MLGLIGAFGSEVLLLFLTLFLPLPELPALVGKVAILVAILVAIATMAREFRWIYFHLPQLRRQTKDIWAKTLPGTLAAALWGFDLGLIFTSRLTFSGVWLLTMVTVITGDSVFGVALFTLYWFGRALSVWIAYLLVPNANATSDLTAEIGKKGLLFQRIHAWGLLWSAAVLLSWLIS